MPPKRQPRRLENKASILERVEERYQIIKPVAEVKRSYKDHVFFALFKPAVTPQNRRSIAKLRKEVCVIKCVPVAARRSTTYTNQQVSVLNHLRSPHPSIMKLIDHDDDHKLWTATPCYQGVTLEELDRLYREADQFIPEDIIDEMLFQASGALAFLHRGIQIDWKKNDPVDANHIPTTHGDINLENIILLPPDPEHERPFRVMLVNFEKARRGPGQVTRMRTDTSQLACVFHYIMHRNSYPAEDTLENTCECDCFTGPDAIAPAGLTRDTYSAELVATLGYSSTMTTDQLSSKGLYEYAQSKMLQQRYITTPLLQSVQDSWNRDFPTDKEIRTAVREIFSERDALMDDADDEQDDDQDNDDDGDEDMDDEDEGDDEDDEWVPTPRNPKGKGRKSSNPKGKGRKQDDADDQQDDDNKNDVVDEDMDDAEDAKDEGEDEGDGWVPLPSNPKVKGKRLGLYYWVPTGKGRQPGPLYF